MCWIARIMITWGFVATAMMFVRTPEATPYARIQNLGWVRVVVNERRVGAATSRFRVPWRRQVEVYALDQHLHAAVRLSSAVVLVPFGNRRLVCLGRHTHRPQHATPLRLNLVRGNLVIHEELFDGLRSLQRE